MRGGLDRNEQLPGDLHIGVPGADQVDMAREAGRAAAREALERAPAGLVA